MKKYTKNSSLFSKLSGLTGQWLVIQNSLHTITLWIASIVFLIVCSLLIYSLVRFRRKSADEPEPDQSFHGNTALEVIWTIIPVGILATLLVLTYQTLNE